MTGTGAELPLAGWSSAQSQLRGRGQGAHHTAISSPAGSCSHPRGQQLSIAPSRLCDGLMFTGTLPSSAVSCDDPALSEPALRRVTAL